MSDNWLLADSYEQGNRVLDALNTLSIHNKLLLAGIDDAKRSGDAERARGELREFLQALDKVVPTIEADSDAGIPGQAPRANAFARRFVQARQQQTDRSSLFALPLKDFIILLDAKEPNARRDLVDGLTTLRGMLEQHHHNDVSRMLGEL